MTITDIVLAIGVSSIVVGLVFIGRKLQSLDTMQATIEKMKNNIKVLGDALIQSEFTHIDTDKLQVYSPIQVTQGGKEYLESVGFTDLFEEHKEDFIDYIDNEQPKTDYDIEQAAIKSVLVLFNEKYFDDIKDYLYNNPKADKKELIKVAGIYVRTQYMKEKGPSFKEKETH